MNKEDLYCPNCDEYFSDDPDLYEVPEGMKYGEREIPKCPNCGGVLE